jgi:hypothetical protein
MHTIMAFMVTYFSMAVSYSSKMLITLATGPGLYELSLPVVNFKDKFAQFTIENVSVFELQSNWIIDCKLAIQLIVISI